MFDPLLIVVIILLIIIAIGFIIAIIPNVSSDVRDFSNNARNLSIYLLAGITTLYYFVGREKLRSIKEYKETHPKGVRHAEFSTMPQSQSYQSTEYISPPQPQSEGEHYRFEEETL